MCIFSLCGNICYLLSILLLSTETTFLLKNLAWIFFAIVMTIMEIIILIQSMIYKDNKIIINLDDIELETISMDSFDT